MSRHLASSHLAFTMGVLALSACHENTTPTEPKVNPSQSAVAAASYRARDLNVNIPGGEFATATSINTAGHVVGTRFQPGDVERAYLWKNGDVTDLGTLGGRTASAADINDAGQVVGSSRNSSGRMRAFRWTDGEMRGLGTLGGRESRAFAINNRGHVVGQSQLSGNPTDPDGDPIIHAFLFRNGVMTDLGTLGGRSSAALDINDDGQVVGWSDTRNGVRHPFLWQNGVMRDLLAPGSENTGTAQGISPFGGIVGERNGRAFRYAGGTIINLGTGPSIATDIRSGRIVGSLETATTGRGFVWIDGEVTKLPFLPRGFRNSANAINSSGRIVGSTFTSGTPGEVRATLWVPE